MTFDECFYDEQRKKIFRFLRQQYPTGYTRQEISHALNTSINAVCGRIGELIEKGAVIVRGKKKNPKSGVMVEVLTVRKNVMAVNNINVDYNNSMYFHRKRRLKMEEIRW